jgi:ribosome-associated protein
MIRTMPRAQQASRREHLAAPDTADEASEAPAFADERPSKSQRKRDADALQVLGRELLALPAARVQALNLPESLLGAMDEYRRTRSFEGQRRQMQYIGRLMRQADPEPIRQAVADHKLGGARDSLRQHQAEAWRQELVADDAALARWLQAHGKDDKDDIQALRQLIRQARSDDAEAQAQAARGQAVRRGRAWRALYQHIHERLTP